MAKNNGENGEKCSPFCHHGENGEKIDGENGENRWQKWQIFFAISKIEQKINGDEPPKLWSSSIQENSIELRAPQ